MNTAPDLQSTVKAFSIAYDTPNASYHSETSGKFNGDVLSPRSYFFSLAFFILSSGWSATAQSDIWEDYEPAKNWADNITFDTQAQIILAAVQGKNSQIVGTASVGGGAQWVGQNGLQIGVTLDIKAQHNHRDRPFGGLTGGISGKSLVLGGGAPASNPDVTLTVETARVDFKNALGELRIGIDQGVGDRFHHGPKQGFEAAALDNATLHPDGITALNTQNTITGNLPKVSYESPRWLGLKLGASVSVPANITNRNSGLAQLIDADELEVKGTPAVIAADYTAKIRNTNLRLLASASVGQLEAESKRDLTVDTANSSAASARLEGKDWSVGLAGRRADTLFSDGTYEALTAGVSFDHPASGNDLKTHILAASVKDDALGLSGINLEIGANFEIATNTRLGFSVRNFKPRNSHSVADIDDQQNIVMELSRSF